MNPVSGSRPRSPRPARLGVGALIVTLSGALLAPVASSAAPASSTVPEASSATEGWDETAYRGGVDVVEGTDADRKTVTGTVFVDRNRSSAQDRNERGLADVTVSNGRVVTTTDSKGRYELPVEDNMTVFVTQPRGYQVPVDDDNVAQFHYHHLPAGSPELRYGGLEPTGPVPDELNFPLTASTETRTPEQHCAIGADVQTYNAKEAEYARAGVFADLAERDDYAGCGVLFIGDVVGDNLSLFDETRDLTRTLNGPARFLPGNHDLDFDSPARDHNFDTFRAQLGPEYFSYDAGKAHVVALSTIEYPGTTSRYTYGLGERQLEWLRNDIAAVPEDRAIVLAGHSPLLEFWYSDSHRTKQLREIYDILEGREVISLGGHTHMSENLREGDLMAGWKDLLGEDGLPFTHLTVGAVSGHWYAGRQLDAGYPTSVQRDGTPPGVLTLDIKNTEITERYTVRGDDGAHQLSLGLNTPRYRDWFTANRSNVGSAPELAEPLSVSREELAGTWLTTNFWMGSTGSTVQVRVDGGSPVEAERTQQLQGEGVRIGAEWSDPTANLETLPHGGGLVERTMHLWRLELPADLAVGEHTAEVTATDVHGREFTQSLTFEVTE